jgi:hypothetical protein
MPDDERQDLLRQVHMHGARQHTRRLAERREWRAEDTHTEQRVLYPTDGQVE